MNILPKKRWHVRTKDNIARVRRDEAQAEEEERQREKRAKLAEQEARTSLLRNRARAREVPDELRESLNKSQEPLATSSSASGPLQHVNLFEDLAQGETTHEDNKEREAEKKQEQEEYEKKIGLLTYLGQDTNELTGERSWWQKLPEKRDEENKLGDKEEEKTKGTKIKDDQDPLKDIRKYLGCDGVKKYLNKKKQDKVSEVGTKKRKRSRSSSSDSDAKSKKRKKKSKKKSSKHKKKKKKRKKHHKKSSSSSDSDVSESEDEQEAAKIKLEKKRRLEKLRLERLKREKVERAKANKLLYGEKKEEEEKDSNQGREEGEKSSHEEEPTRGKARKYNSQFNPQLAKQNKLDATKKYWLE